MSFIAGILTFLLIANCLLLILLVLVQLPKKDAGAGIAFGGGTADALFGAGSGNVLTKITKYATGILLVLSLILGYVMDKAHNRTNGSDFEKMVEQQTQQKPLAPATPPAATAPAQTPPTASLPAVTAPVATNAPAAK